MSRDWKSEIIMITGSSSGLGRALSLKAGELGATVIMIARTQEHLNQVRIEVESRGGMGHVFPFDLHHVNKIADLYAEIKTRIGNTPTILINNAGYNATGFVQNTPVDVYEDNYRVNVLAPIALIQSVLPDMIENRKGAIVNILGAANYHSFPCASSYSSTKVALQAIHESLQAEVAGLPVQTLRVNPGGFRSNYHKNRKIDGRLKDYRFPEHRGGKDPAVVADAIFRAMEEGKEEIDLSSGMDRIGHHLNYWMPRLVDKLLVSRNKKLIRKRPA